MSSDDVTVTDRDRAAAYNIAKNWSDHPTDLAEEIAQALAQARSEGREEGEQLPQSIAGLKTVLEEERADRAERCLQEQHEATDALWNERHALQQRADAAEEALRVAREAMAGINHCLGFMSTGADNVLANMVPKINKLNATLAPTTASTKTAQEDATEIDGRGCKDKRQ